MVIVVKAGGDRTKVCPGVPDGDARTLWLPSGALPGGLWGGPHAPGAELLHAGDQVPGPGRQRLDGRVRLQPHLRHPPAGAKRDPLVPRSFPPLNKKWLSAPEVDGDYGPFESWEDGYGPNAALWWRQVE